MKLIDFIIALLCGLAIGFVANDFLKDLGINLNVIYILILLSIFSIFSVICLWISFIIGKKFLFVFQGAKYILIGSFSTVADIKIFELLFFSAPFIFLTNIFIAKSFSFLIVTSARYIANKYWIFKEAHFNYGESATIFPRVLYGAGIESKYKKADLYKEISVFFVITLVGLAINVTSFYFFVNAIGPQFSIPSALWLKLSVILAASIAFIWNFTGYKFLVFKK